MLIKDESGSIKKLIFDVHISFKKSHKLESKDFIGVPFFKDMGNRLVLTVKSEHIVNSQYPDGMDKTETFSVNIDDVDYYKVIEYRSPNK